MAVSLANLVSLKDCIAVVAESRPQKAPEKILNFRVEQLSDQPGYLGEYAYLLVTVEDIKGCNHELRYFVKSLPYSDSKQRKIVQEFGMFAKEAHIYRDLFALFEQSQGKVTKWKPNCWLMKDDLLIMEDLQGQGFKTMPYGQDFDKEHMLLMLDCMAQMHACSLNLEYNRMGGEKLEPQFSPILFEGTIKRDNTWFEVGLKAIQQAALSYSKYSENIEYRKVIQEEMMSRMDKVYDLVQPTDRYQCVINHRDLWYGNMMFQFAKGSKDESVDYTKPTSCLLIDFQLSRYLPPAVDFRCAVYLLTKRAHRDELFETYVEHYYKQLSENLSKLNLKVDNILPKGQFLKSL
ncbi:uncharacterized protein LOC129747915 [Uranotaenia lowii]|uniref:uncharacterized protein LOC129747915 n=1 Tax=Uranotaenia lowii TaxID=190385 RepID=UPI002478DF9B|nr:uncharacterized protein LOC129747915 [Uranotaenia lowii]